MAFNVKDFGALGDDIKDDTLSIQAAIAAAEKADGGEVLVPVGTYKLTGTLNIAGAGVAVRGESRLSAALKQYAQNAPTIKVTGNFFSLKSLCIYYNGTPSMGGTAIHTESSYSTFDDFVIRSAYRGVVVMNGASQKMTGFEIFDYEDVGIFVSKTNDIFVSRFLMNAGNTSRGIGGGIRLIDKVEAFVCSDGDILLGVYSMTTDGAEIGNRPAYCNFSNVFFDSSDGKAGGGVVLEKIVESEFVGCWFSNGRTGSGNAGLFTNNVDSLGFTNCRFFNCGGDGAFIRNSSVRMVFKGCKFESNSVTSGDGIANGLRIESGTKDFIVQGCIAHNGLYSGKQKYGILVEPGSSDRYIIADNLVNGNVKPAGVSDGGRGRNKHVRNNY